MISEHQEHHHIEGSSNRSFGLTVGGILLAIEIYRSWAVWEVDGIGVALLSISIPLIFLGGLFPSMLAPLNKGWMKLGFIMFKVVNPKIMLAIYVLTIIPIGLMLKLAGKDPMRKKLDENAKSYWIEREPLGPSPESMKNQF